MADRSHTPEAPGVIQLLLADVDGVVTAGEGHPADLGVLARLTEINRAARDDPLVPAVTLCTGRQGPYVEVMAQMVGAYLPCIFEHGAGLFDPSAYRFNFHPSLGPDHPARLAALRAALDGPLLRPGRAFVQPGKEAMLTLYPLGDTTLDRIVEEARLAVERLGHSWSVERNLLCVDIRAPGIDKGVGTRWLAETLGIDLASMAGVGDSDPDLVFLDLVGFAAAPANATEAVRAAVRYVAAGSDGVGLLEIIEQVIAANRRAA